MVTGPEKFKRSSKNSCECRIEIGLRMPNERKRPREPTSNVMDQESPSSMNEDPIAMMGHHNQIKEEHTTGPKEAQ